MQAPRKTLIALQIAVLLSLGPPIIIAPAQAALPVIDGSNLSQNVVTAVENVAHTLKQIQQYQTQLQQYQNMLQNTMAPAAYIWDMASRTMNDLRTSIDTLQHYKSTLGNIDRYLAKFKDTSGYRSSPCFSARGCSNSDWAILTESRELGSEAQKRAADGLLKGLDKQQDMMEADARQLQRLQSLAQGANGQLQAIGFANQLASQQTNQLLQVRALLLAQQNVIATRERVLADIEAKQQVAHDSSAEQRGPANIPATPMKW